MRCLQLHEVNAQREWASCSFLTLTYISDTTFLGAIKSNIQFLYCIFKKKIQSECALVYLKLKSKYISLQHINCNCNVILVHMQKKNTRNTNLTLSSTSHESIFNNIFPLNTHTHIYRVSQEVRAKLREGVPYVKLYRYNPKHLCPKLNGYGDKGQRKVWSFCGSTYCTWFA